MRPLAQTSASARYRLGDLDRHSVLAVRLRGPALCCERQAPGSDPADVSGAATAGVHFPVRGNRRLSRNRPGLVLKRRKGRWQRSCRPRRRRRRQCGPRPRELSVLASPGAAVATPFGRQCVRSRRNRHGGEPMPERCCDDGRERCGRCLPDDQSHLHGGHQWSDGRGSVCCT